MEKDICTLIEETLQLPQGSVKPEDGPHSLEAWDSLGFLSILAALEKKYGNKIAGIYDLSSAESVKDIVTLLERENIG